MKNLYIAVSDLHNKWARAEAKQREITLSDMFRRILDDRYEETQGPKIPEEEKE